MTFDDLVKVQAAAQVAQDLLKMAAARYEAYRALVESDPLQLLEAVPAVSAARDAAEAAQIDAVGAAMVANQAVEDMATLLAGAGVDHQWSGTSLRLRLAGGAWGAWVDLRGPQGHGIVVRGTLPDVDALPPAAERGHAWFIGTDVHVWQGTKWQNMGDPLGALASHAGDTANPHAVTKSQVGLGSADDTADLVKPVSVDQMAAIRRYAAAASTAGDWLVRGPDGALPVQQSEWVRGAGWFDGVPASTVADYLDLAGGVFSRGSDGTYFDLAGNMLTAGPHELRLDHDPATGEALGYRAEGTGTNLAPWSSDFSQAALWAISNFNRTPGQPSLRPGEDATLFTKIGAGAGQIRTNSIVIPLPAVTASIFARKASGANEANQFAVRNASRNETWRIDNINYDTLAAFNGGGAQRATTDLVTRRCADDWVQIVYRNQSDISADENFWLYLISSGAVSPEGQAAMAMGAHIRAGGVLDSYIPTAGGAAVRMADSLSFPVSPASEGTVVIRARAALGGGATQVLWQGGSDVTTNTNRVYLIRNPSGVLVALVNQGGGPDVVTLVLGAVADGEDFKVALSWRQGRVAASRNGGAPVVNTAYTGPMPTVVRTAEGAQPSGSLAWFGTIARTVRWDRAYSPAQLQEMSAP